MINLLERLPCDPGCVGGKDDPIRIRRGQIQERIVGERRLRIEHIEGGPGDFSLQNRAGKRFLVHRLAAGGVDQKCGRLHPRKALRVHKADRIWRHRDMDAHQIAFMEQLVKFQI